MAAEKMNKKEKSTKKSKSSKNEKTEIKAKSKPFVFGQNVEVTDDKVSSMLTTESTFSEPRDRPIIAPAPRHPDSDDENEQTNTLKKSSKNDKMRTKRTVFVGNLPADAKKKKLETLFQDYGAIETIRFRSISLASLQPGKNEKAISRAQAVMTRTKHEEEATTVNAYIVYETVEAAEKAVCLNNTSFGSQKIRVDMAGNAKKHDHDRSIFVGNLLFTLTDEDLREFFSPCGDVEGVRIIRDPLTTVGKGFGYVKFCERSSVSTALQMDQMPLQERNIRVSKSSSSAPKKGDKKGNNNGKLMEKRKRDRELQNDDNETTTPKKVKITKKRNASGDKKRLYDHGKARPGRNSNSNSNSNSNTSGGDSKVVVQSLKRNAAAKASEKESWQGLTAKEGTMHISSKETVMAAQDKKLKKEAKKSKKEGKRVKVRKH